eukprot:scaffold2321_cov329-Prasinococcus_capsulatus_cf.AAC.6
MPAKAIHGAHVEAAHVLGPQLSRHAVHRHGAWHDLRVFRQQVVERVAQACTAATLSACVTTPSRGAALQRWGARCMPGTSPAVSTPSSTSRSAMRRLQKMGTSLRMRRSVGRLYVTFTCSSE